MTIKDVIEAIERLTGKILASIRAFVNSDDFKNTRHKIGAWLESATLWLVNAIIGLTLAIVRSCKSDRFRQGVRRVRELGMRACQQGLLGIRWLANRLREIAGSEVVETAVTTVSDLVDLLLPKPGQRAVAFVSICIVASILVLSWPKSEPTETITEPVETVATTKKTAPKITRIVSGMPDFDAIPAGRERKAAFFGYFLPIIEDQNRKILATREKLDNWYQDLEQIDSSEAAEISKIADHYRIDDFDLESDASWHKLFNRVDVVPPSLALAQSANESAWGTSRFAREGLNFFGQWCFSKGCGLVPKKRDPGKTHEVAAFDSPQESVRMYIRNLNSNSAYKGLRDIRAALRKANQAVTGHELAAGLKRYSERGMEYVRELRQMIAGNQLAAYDTF